jgi:uncharacterized membrane protein
MDTMISLRMVMVGEGMHDTVSVVRAESADVYSLENAADEATRTGSMLELEVDASTDRGDLRRVAPLCRRVVRKDGARLRVVDRDVAGHFQDERSATGMSSIEKSIDVHAPVNVVYENWKRIPTFPWFMKGITEVQSLGENRSRWSGRIAGVERSWEAAICEEIPNTRIAWKSTAGAEHAGVVTFHRLSDGETRVMLQLEYEPESVLERVGDLLGAPSVRIEGDLGRFKEWVENGPLPLFAEALGA